MSFPCEMAELMTKLHQQQSAYLQNEMNMPATNADGRIHSLDPAIETSVRLVGAVGQMNCVTVVWMQQKIVSKLYNFANCCYRLSRRRCCCYCLLSLTNLFRIQITSTCVASKVGIVGMTVAEILSHLLCCSAQSFDFEYHYAVEFVLRIEMMR